MEMTFARAKPAEQPRVLEHWLLPFPAHVLEQSHLQLVFPWKDQTVSGGKHSPTLAPGGCPCSPGGDIPPCLIAEQIGEGDGVSSGTTWFTSRGGQMCCSAGRVDCRRGDFRVPVCASKASIPGNLEGGETTHLRWLCREEHLGSPWNTWRFNSFLLLDYFFVLAVLKKFNSTWKHSLQEKYTETFWPLWLTENIPLFKMPFVPLFLGEGSKFGWILKCFFCVCVWIF